jgi:glutaminyl-peptide cyclotransferase
MKKSLIIAALFIVAILVLSASIIFFVDNSKTGSILLPAPTATATSTLNPASTASPEVTPTASPPATPTLIHYTYTLVNTYPHDPNAFTEGLLYSDGSLYESTGINGNSSLRCVDLITGNILQEYALPDQYFGEGIAVVNNTILQLTWESQIGFIYDKTTFATLGNFSFSTEGWGLTFDGKHLIMSDGTNNLYFIDPTTFERTGQIQVHDGNTTIVNINELEYINGDVYANIWQTNTIAIINPQTGQVKAWIDLTGITSENNSDPNSVLNGIAYDQNSNRLFVTGKDWPSLYEIKLVPVPTPTA